MSGSAQENGAAVPRFPLFITLQHCPVLVVGGGEIAARRVSVLLEFGARVTVVSPALCPKLEAIREQITWQQEPYSGIHAAYTLVVAATDDRAVNAKVGEDARHANIPVSVADCRDESTFWFPAVVRGGNMVAGVVSTNGDHKAVKETAAVIRAALEGKV